jgi:divalent metal cation (Fe/Co/Zn/Cd) transporter
MRVELDLELPDSLSLLEAHRHSEALERVIAEELSERVEITIHLEPSREYIRVAGGTTLRRLQFVRRF